MTDTTIEKAPGACDTEGFDTDTNAPDSATGSQNSKAIATQIAELALAGYAVHKLCCNNFLVCRFGHSHYAQDFQILQAFARKLVVSK